MKRLRVFFVGAGRAGGALAVALERAGHRVAAEHRSPRALARAHRLGIPHAPFGLRTADVVFIAVPDAVIADAVGRRRAGLSRGQVVAHLSGALGLKPLAAARAAGALVGSLHPLCAIPSVRSRIVGARAAIDGGPRARAVLSRLARDAGLSPIHVRRADRALYHGAAVLASNGVVALADEAARLLKLCGFSRRRAVEALVRLMLSALEGVQGTGLPAALTGPVARGDARIVAGHLAALRRRSPGTLPLYLATTQILARLSRELGEADLGGLARIERLVEGTRKPRSLT